MNYGKWTVKSINISESLTNDICLHTFNTVSNTSSIIHSIFYLNDAYSIIFYQTYSSVNAYECNLLNNTDHGNYRFPGLCYSNEGHFYITKCNFVGNNCTWLFLGIFGDLIVDNTYVDNNEYKELNSINASIIATNKNFDSDFIITIKTYAKCEYTGNEDQKVLGRLIDQIFIIIDYISIIQ